MSGKIGKMKLRYWKYALFWSLLILYYSTDRFSAGNTDSIFANIINFFYDGLNADQMYLLHIRFRKFMHFFNYAILSWLVLLGVSRSFSPFAKWNLKYACYTLLFCLICASIDECNQHFSSVRGGSIRDVGIDMIGAVCVQLIFWIGARKRIET